MSRKTLLVLFMLVFAIACTSALAQDPPADPDTDSYTPPSKIYKLLRDDSSAADDLDLDEEEEKIWIPGLKKGTVEITIGLGFLNLNTTLLQHDQMIYKYNTEATFWGDVELKGESAFAPTLNLGYGITEWFVLKGWGGVSISEYKSTIENTFSRKNEPEAPAEPNPEMGEFDAEARSLITIQTGVNAVIYPFDMGGDASGVWHPYVTGGVGNMWYNMNSNYTDETASAIDLNYGAGIRLLADEKVSILLEVTMHHNELEWTPAEYFIELNEGTTRVPLNHYPLQDDGTRPDTVIESFESNTMSLLQWTLGIHGSF